MLVCCLGDALQEMFTTSMETIFCFLYASSSHCGQIVQMRWKSKAPLSPTYLSYPMSVMGYAINNELACYLYVEGKNIDGRLFCFNAYSVINSS